MDSVLSVFRDGVGNEKIAPAWNIDGMVFFLLFHQPDGRHVSHALIENHGCQEPIHA